MTLPPIAERDLATLREEAKHLKETTDAVRRIAREYPGADLETVVSKIEEAWRALDDELNRRAETGAL